jgi:ABC-type spermidine/putrescine transport system permease subunit I
VVLIVVAVVTYAATRPTLRRRLDLTEGAQYTLSEQTRQILADLPQPVTFIELLIGFPFALWLAKGGASKTTRAIVLALLTIPFFLDLSSRTIVWRAILGQNGLVNSVLGGLGIIDAPLEWILYTEWAVHFGMVLTYFPLMVLPIYRRFPSSRTR